MSQHLRPYNMAPLVVEPTAAQVFAGEWPGTVACGSLEIPKVRR